MVMCCYSELYIWLKLSIFIYASHVLMQEKSTLQFFLTQQLIYIRAKLKSTIDSLGIFVSDTSVVQVARNFHLPG